MELNTMILWFGTAVSVIYGLLIGSFLNVAIYRLPPKVFLFDDLFYDPKSSGLIDDLKVFLEEILPKNKKKSIPENMEPFLYAEPLVFASISPEMTGITALSSAFNLYQEYLAVPMTVNQPKRSFCPSCRNLIRWWMNIPVFSFILLKGKCHYCQQKISWRYPLIELTAGILTGCLFYIYGMKNLPLFLLSAILTYICIVVFFIDLDNWLILDEITLPFTAVGLLGSFFIHSGYFNPLGKIPGLDLYMPVQLPTFLMELFKPRTIGPASFPLHLDSFFHSLIGAVSCFLLLYSIAVIGTALAKREAMGGGDIKFAMLMGAFLGIQKASLAFFLAVLIGTTFMLPGLILRRKTGKDHVPFGCFLTVGTIITIFYGEKILEFYMHFPFNM